VTPILIPGPAAPGVIVPGPADLMGKSGHLLMVGAPLSELEQAYWSVALGTFAARGGSIEWRHP
jgi:hypothetical protein